MSKKELPPNLREDNLSEETKILTSSLLSEKDSVGKLCNYQGCWYYYNTLQGVVNFQRNFEPQDTDIILASFPKSGTTWLKALTIALLERSKNDRSNDDIQKHHPLESNNPHGLVPFLEINSYLDCSTPDLTKLSSSSSSPRLFSTHMPLHTLQVPLKDSPCKIVYVCRNLKDVLVSYWHFRCTNLGKTEAERSITLESMFNSFCSGVHYYGPFWENVLSYWRGSLEDPKHVLFMRYEDLKADPRGQIKILAEFLGCPFSEEEEHSGYIDKILELCSLRNLSSLEINKTGKTSNDVHHSSFFRKGEVGGWKNHLTPEMENKIDSIVAEKFKGAQRQIRAGFVTWVQSGQYHTNGELDMGLKSPNKWYQNASEKWTWRFDVKEKSLQDNLQDNLAKGTRWMSGSVWALPLGSKADNIILMGSWTWA